MNLLHEFFNSKSDASNLEATKQEVIENAFENLSESETEHLFLKFVDDMCTHSLDPETHNKWEEVKQMLIQNALKNLTTSNPI